MENYKLSLPYLSVTLRLSSTFLDYKSCIYFNHVYLVFIHRRFWVAYRVKLENSLQYDILSCSCRNLTVCSAKRILFRPKLTVYLLTVPKYKCSKISTWEESKNSFEWSQNFNPKLKSWHDLRFYAIGGKWFNTMFRL